MLLQEMNNFDEINYFFKNNYWNKIGIFMKLIWKVSMRWKNWSDLKGLHSMNFREEDWSKIEDTIRELTVKIQEQQNEVNCMNDPRVFKDAESVRSGQSHVASQPVFFPPHPHLGGTLSRSLGLPSRNDRPPSILDTHGTSGNVFCKSRCVIIRTLPSRTESMEFIDRGAASFIHSGKEWKANTRSRSEMPVWTVSQTFSHP